MIHLIFVVYTEIRKTLSLCRTIGMYPLPIWFIFNTKLRARTFNPFTKIEGDIFDRRIFIALLRK